MVCSHNGQLRGNGMLGLKVVTAAAVAVVAAVCVSTASAGVVQQAPASGSVVNGDFHLVLQAPARVPVWVRLNGRAVALPPPLRDGRMELWPGPGDGLRRGANVLAVGLGANGRALVRRRFRLTSGLPLAAADDVTTSPGDPVTLDAGAVKDRAGGPLRYRWRLVSGGRGLGLPRSGSGRRLVLDPRARGRAVYSLRVTEAGSRGGAPVSSTVQFVTATVEPASPLVAIDTDPGGDGGANGIRVGATVYAAPAPEGGEKAALQVVALDRGTLALISNFTIGCAIADSICEKSIFQKLKGLGNALVIASVHRDYLKPFTHGLSAIGGPASATPGTDGTFAAIGVPGMAVGSGWSAGGPGPGRLRGYATQDTWGNWTYTAGDPVAFDTNPGSSHSDSSIRVGNSTYALPKIYGPEDDGCREYEASGYWPAAQLLIVNRFTLAPVRDRVYAVSSACPINALADALNDVKSNEIALLSGTDGFADKSPFASDAEMRAARASVALAVQRLGGVRDTVTRLGNHTPYSLVGWPGLKSGQAPEASPVLSEGQATGRIAGTLSRDQTNGYTVDTASYATGPENQVAALLYQKAEGWPLLDTEAHRRALAWVEDRVDAGGNLRVDYWQQGWSDAVWIDKKTELLRLEFPGGDPGFEAGDLTDVKDELAREITWLISVRSYFARLGAPYSDGALASLAELQKIAGKVQDGVQPPPDATAQLPWLTFAGEVGGLVATGGGFTPHGNAFRVLATIVSTLKTGIALARATGGAPVSDADYRAKVADLAVTLANNIQRSKDALKRMQAIVAGDYGKLKKLGELGDCSQTSSKCPKEWQLPASAESFARSLLIVQAKHSFYSALLPLKFEADILNPSPTGGRDASARDWWCGRYKRVPNPPFREYNKDHSFGKEPDSGFVQLQYIEATQNPPTRWETLALRVRGPLGLIEYPMPKASLLDPLFAPLDLTNPTGDNLGLIKTQFYVQTWGINNRPNFGCQAK